MKAYALFDAALVPQVWTHLEYWGLNYEPLYRYPCKEIEEAIPYLIELDTSINRTVVHHFFTKEEYNSALIILSQSSLEKLVNRLARFYHVTDEKGEPMLWRFYDIRNIDAFFKSLDTSSLDELFSPNTRYYYFDKPKKIYRAISYDQDELIYTTESKSNIFEHCSIV